MIDNEEFAQRNDALAIAEAYADKIFEKYPPEDFYNTQTPTPMFTVPVKNTVTKTQQMTNTMLDIASWLVKTE